MNKEKKKKEKKEKKEKKKKEKKEKKEKENERKEKERKEKAAERDELVRKDAWKHTWLLDIFGQRGLRSFVFFIVCFVCLF